MANDKTNEATTENKLKRINKGTSIALAVLTGLWVFFTIIAIISDVDAGKAIFLLALVVYLNSTVLTIIFLNKYLNK